MRIPFPERIPIFGTLVFALVLCLLQQLQGTTVLFSSCTFGFILIAVIAFNTVGGLTRPSGGYIFSYTLLVVLFGITYKVFVGEPGQSNLQQPDLTIEVYLASITATLVAAYVSKRFRFKKILVPRYKSDADMGRAAYGCFAVGSVTTLYLMFRPPGAAAGSFPLLGLFSSFLIFAIIIGVMYGIRRSGGRRSLSIPTLISGVILFSNGIIHYSKEGLFTPFLCWLVAASSQRYKLSLIQIGGLLLGLSFITYYLVPYSQYGRKFRIEEASFSENWKTNVLLLSNLGVVRKAFLDESNLLYTGTDYSRYYDKPQGLADRLQMITPDDLVINYTAHGGGFGLFPTIFSYENLIPHFIWHDKPTIQFGNLYAHELGMLPDEDDDTTGISFSPTGDAFHQAKWVGILVVLPILLFIMFLALDSACGDTRESPIALVALFGFGHSAPEGGLTEIIRGPTIGLAGLLFSSFIVVYLMPLIGNVVLGPVRTTAAGAPLVPSEAFRR